MWMLSSITCVNQFMETALLPAVDQSSMATRRTSPLFPHLDFNDGKCKTGSGHIENYHDIYQVYFLCSYPTINST